MSVGLAFVIFVAGGLVWVSTIPSSDPTSQEPVLQLLGNIPITDFPDGIIKTLLIFWESLRNSYVNILEKLGNVGVDALGFSPISIFLGVGLSAYIGYKLVRWVIKP